jgi:hypothetical protein
MNRIHYHRAPKKSQDALVGRYPCSGEQISAWIIEKPARVCQNGGQTQRVSSREAISSGRNRCGTAGDYDWVREMTLERRRQFGIGARFCGGDLKTGKVEIAYRFYRDACAEAAKPQADRIFAGDSAVIRLCVYTHSQSNSLHNCIGNPALVQRKIGAPIWLRPPVGRLRKYCRHAVSWDGEIGEGRLRLRGWSQ